MTNIGYNNTGVLQITLSGDVTATLLAETLLITTDGGAVQLDDTVTQQEVAPFKARGVQGQRFNTAAELAQYFQFLKDGGELMQYSDSFEISTDASGLTVSFNGGTDYDSTSLVVAKEDSGTAIVNTFRITQNDAILFKGINPTGVTINRNRVSMGTTALVATLNAMFSGNTATSDEELAAIMKYFKYDEPSDKLVATRAIETTLNSLFLGDQHKMSSGAENIFFTNLGNNTNFFPMWGGLKDQSITANQGASGFIAPSGRVYTDMFSTELGGQPDLTTSVGYSGPNYFGDSTAGLGITTVAAEEVNLNEVKLEYRLFVNDVQVYKQVLPPDSVRETNMVYPNDLVEWFFDHPVEIHAGTTIYAEITKVRKSDDANLGIFQVRRGDTNDLSTGLPRYQTIVHNRLFEDKDLEMISPYLKYKSMDFGLDATGATIFLRDLSLGADSVLTPYAVNTIEAVANGSEITIKVKGGSKVIIESLPVNAITVDGVYVNSILNEAVVKLNGVFTNTDTFYSQGNPVTGFDLVGDDLTLTLSDGTSYTTDVTTLGVDENKFVASAELDGTDLKLTMNDSTTVVVDASPLAVDEDTTITGGSVSGDTLTLNVSDSSTVSIDVTSLALDEDTYVDSGELNADGINIDLTMDDGSVVQVPVGDLAIDTDTVVSGGQVVGTDIVLTLSDSSTVTIDASSLDTGSSTNVVSGAVVGSNLVLTMSDATEITIDATNMINGSTGLSGAGQGWFVSYGANAGVEITQPVSGTYSLNNSPLHFGEQLEVGTEFVWQQHHLVNSADRYMTLGVWGGITYDVSGQDATLPTNWTTKFGFYHNLIVEDTSTNANGGFSSKNTDVAASTTYPNGTIMRLVYGEDFKLRLYADDVLLGTSVLPESGNPLDISLASSDMQVEFPNVIKRTADWEIVHDFNNSENGDILNGIEVRTAIQSYVSIGPGEKCFIPLNRSGFSERFGIDWTGDAQGVSSTFNKVLYAFVYGSHEQIIPQNNGQWDFNTASPRFVDIGDGKWTVGNGVFIGNISLRYQANNTLELYSETYQEVIATLIDSLDGLPFRLVMLANEPMSNYKIPHVSKQTIGQGRQPVTNYAPIISDQTINVTESLDFNVKIESDAGSPIVTHYIAEDAPSWANLNEATGVFTGIAPAHAGDAGDTVAINCKAANAIGGATNFIVTLQIAETTYTNTKSLQFPDGSNSYLSANPSGFPMERFGNGTGDSDAWCVSFWYKKGTGTSADIMYYGASDSANDGYIKVSQANGTKVAFHYGTDTDYLRLETLGTTSNTGDDLGTGWHHISVGYSGEPTGSSSTPADFSTSMFMFIDGVLQPTGFTHGGEGYSGSIKAERFYIGNSTNSNFQKDGKLNQLAIYNSNQYDNMATNYNSGVMADLREATNVPNHYYEIENSTTMVTDLIGGKHLIGYNFNNTDLVTDAP